MTRKQWQQVIVLVVAVLAVARWTVAWAQDEPAAADLGELSDAADPAGESLAEADAEVFDATAEVAAPVDSPREADAAELSPRDDTPPDLGDLQVLLHGDGNALVLRRDTFKLRVGENELALDQVANRVDPSTVRLRPLGDPLAFTILEQTGLGAVASATELLQSAVGEPVQVRDGNYLVEGTLLAVDDKGVIVAANDRLHIHPAGEVIVPGFQRTAALAPKLAWKVTADRAGEVPAEVSYLTAGLTWAADYALTVTDRDRMVSFDGWVSVDNRSGLDFPQAGLLFVTTPALPAADEPVEGPTARYYLPRTVALPDGVAKRFALAQARGIRSAVRFEARLDETGLAGVRLTAELRNDAAAGLGLPLPPGPVRLYAPDRVGRLQLLGEQPLPATAVDAPLRFDLGPTDDVIAEVTTNPVAEVTEGAPGETVERVVRLRNQRTEDVVVSVAEVRGGVFAINGASVTFGEPVDGRAVAEVTVPASAVVEVRYRVRVVTPAAPAAGSPV